MFTRNANLRWGTTSVMVLVVAQNNLLRRFRFTVRVPCRTGPSAFIIRHCGLHVGIRRRSVINSQTLSVGALMSIWACNSGSAICDSSKSAQPGLGAARSAAGRTTLPQKHGCAEDRKAEPRHGHRTPTL